MDEVDLTLTKIGPLAFKALSTKTIQKLVLRGARARSSLSPEQLPLTETLDLSSAEFVKSEWLAQAAKAGRLATTSHLFLQGTRVHESEDLVSVIQRMPCLRVLDLSYSCPPSGTGFNLGVQRIIPFLPPGSTLLFSRRDFEFLSTETKSLIKQIGVALSTT